MRIAFYAPMKPPSHPTPSGDRRMARLLIQALRAAGHRVTLASRFRSRDGTGDPARQARLSARGQGLARRLAARYRALPADRRPQAWFTYHLYYKAPDWLGPAVSAALGLPYLVAEASIAPKRADGPWRLGHQASAAAVAAADAVLCFNAVDPECLRPLLADPGRLVGLKPFLDAAPFAAVGRPGTRAALAGRLGLDADRPWLIAVAMMRRGDKLASFRVLGRALAQIADRPWALLVAGDGPARAEVESALAPLGPRVRYLGRQAPAALPDLYQAGDPGGWESGWPGQDDQSPGPRAEGGPTGQPRGGRKIRETGRRLQAGRRGLAEIATTKAQRPPGVPRRPFALPAGSGSGKRL